MKGSKLKKPSAANLISPLEPPIFFIDRSLGKKIIPNALREIGEKVIAHDERFSPTTRDVDWLKEAGLHRWIVLTKDTQIRYHKNEIVALIRAKVRAFILTAKDLQGSEMAQIFIKALPIIKDLSLKTPAPFIARITRDSNVAIIYPANKV